MKTNLISLGKIKTIFATATIVLSLVSCVSYQSTSQDEDGIYGVTKAKKVAVDNSGQEYKNYFKDLKADNAQVFTDVEKYSSIQDTTKSKTNEVVEYQTQANPAWGSNPSTVNVTIIDNSWGWNNGFGVAWGSPWGWGWNGGWGYGWNNWGWNGGWGTAWGSPWGWGWNNGWGYGWNNWGWGGNPYWGNGWNNWGYANNFYYANSRRGGNVRDGYYGNNYSGRYAQNQQGRRSSSDSGYSGRNVRTAVLPGSRNESGTRSYEGGTRGSGTRGSATNTTTQPTRTYENNGTRSSTTPTRTYTPAPTRSYSPSPSRSSSSGGSYGGSRSSGGSSSGGGRSSSGGGRRG